jgi:hypothetical protein
MNPSVTECNAYHYKWHLHALPRDMNACMPSDAVTNSKRCTQQAHKGVHHSCCCTRICCRHHSTSNSAAAAAAHMLLLLLLLLRLLL